MIYEASAVQQSIWMAEKYSCEGAYNIAWCASAPTIVDHQLLGALGALLQANRILSSRFTVYGLKLCYTFAEDDTPAFTVTQCRSETECLDLIQKHIDARFDLANGPLVRGLVCKCATNAYFSVVIHHIVIDSVSFWRAVNDLGTAYSLLNAGAELVPKRAYCDYDNFVAAERTFAESEVGRRQLEHWRTLVERPLPPLSIGNVPLSGAVKCAARKTFGFGSGRREKIFEFAKKAEVTVFTALAAAYVLALHVYSGQETIAIGTPLLGRLTKSDMMLRGCTVNALPLIVQIDRQKTVEEFLRYVAGVVGFAVENQQTPAAHIVRGLNTDRASRFYPLFQAMFIYQQSRQNEAYLKIVTGANGAERANWGGLEIGSIGMRQEDGQFPLSLEISDLGDDFTGVFKYDSALDRVMSSAQFIVAFLNALDGMIAAPLVGVSSVCGSVAEPSRISRAVPWAEQWDAVIERIARTADKIGESHAVRVFDEKLECVAVYSYTDLISIVGRLAYNVQETFGDVTNKPILCGFPRSMESIVAMLAVWRVGGIYVPVDLNGPVNRLERALELAPAGILCASGSTALRIKTITVEIGALRVCSGFEVPTVRGDNAYIMFTSGSAGVPKAVEVSTRALTHQLQAFLTDFKFLPGYTHLWVAPPTFDASLQQCLASLISGGTLDILPDKGYFPLDLAAALIAAGKVDVLSCVPGVMEGILDYLNADKTSKDISIKYIILAGEVFRRDLLDKLRRRCVSDCIANVYGPTEASINATVWFFEADAYRGDDLPIGMPFCGYSVDVRDTLGFPVPRGAVGELWIGGMGLSNGYVGNPEENAAKFVTNTTGETMYKTGDLAYVTPRGLVHFVGRRDSQIKVNGIRIELEEIDSVLAGHPDIKQAAATYDKVSGKLVGYLVTEKQIALDDIVNWASRSLVSQLIPRRYVVVDALTRGVSGKLDRQQLPLMSGRSLHASSSKHTESVIEQLVKEIWSEAVGVEIADLDSGFFEVGGDSLKLLKVVENLAHRTGIQLTLAEAFEGASVRQLATLLRNRGYTGL